MAALAIREDVLVEYRRRDMGRVRLAGDSTAIRALMPLVPGTLGILDAIQPGAILTVDAGAGRP